jgi:hypothetical protein
MFDYFLAKFRDPDGTVHRRAVCGANPGSALEMAGRFMAKASPGWRETLTVEDRGQIHWTLGAPIRAKPWFVQNGQIYYNSRDHLFAGGDLYVQFRGRDYKVSADLSPGAVSRAEQMARAGTGTGITEHNGHGDDDEDPTTYIGVATILCREHPDLKREIALEGLDEAHAMDRLTGELLVWDSEIEDMPERTQQMSLAHG